MVHETEGIEGLGEWDPVRIANKSDYADIIQDAMTQVHTVLVHSASDSGAQC